MKKVFLIHGYGGEPNGGWRPWLMGELAREDVWACAPQMPMSDSPKKDEWVSEIARQVGEPSEEIFLIGHSLGVCGILHYLQSLPEGSKIGGTILVSGPIHVISGDKYIPIYHFMDTPFNFGHIKNIVERGAIIHGDTDMVVPFSHAEELARELSYPLISIKNGGHLNGSSGWYQLPEALEVLKKMF
jgi:predicted alpha/beta hydrolase family esterase